MNREQGAGNREQGAVKNEQLVGWVSDSVTQQFYTRYLIQFVLNRLLYHRHLFFITRVEIGNFTHVERLHFILPIEILI